MENRFNLRVYGLIINDREEILVSDEFCQNRYMTKFPGGGLEYGEGLIEGLMREFMEECGEEVEVLNHFYTTDFFIESMFRGGGQLISIYYSCRFKSTPGFSTITNPYEGVPEKNDSIAFRWISLSSIVPEDMTFPVDRHVVGLLKQTLLKPNT
jgi:ADP-ribose pyrophosphatase YjhB (NUDIX family)